MEAKSKVEKVKQMGFTSDEACAIVYAAGPRLSVECVKWTLRIWNEYGLVLEGEDDGGRQEMSEFDDISGGPQLTKEESENLSVASEMDSLIEKLLLELPTQEEPLQPLLYGGGLNKISIDFPSTLKSDAELILNGAIEVVHCLRESAPSIRSKAS